VVAALCKLLQLNDDDASLPLSAETRLLTAFHNALPPLSRISGKAAILVSIAQLLDPDQIHNSTSTRRPSDALGAKLFVAIGQVNDQHSTIPVLMSMVRSPIPEIRLGIYVPVLFEAVAKKMSTGAQIMLLHPDILPFFLLLRENETTHEGHKARYTIVQVILVSRVKVLLADAIVRQLESYVSQGQHYQKARGTWDVATED
jgi:hypothetical protein